MRQCQISVIGSTADIGYRGDSHKVSSLYDVIDRERRTVQVGISYIHAEVIADSR